MPGGEEDDGDSVLSEDGVSSGGHESVLELWTSTGRSLAVGAGGPSRDVLTLTEGRLRMTFAGTSLVVHLVKSLPAAQEVQVPSLGRADPLEEEMAAHSSILAWSIPRAGEPGGLQSVGSQRVRHD